MAFESEIKILITVAQESQQALATLASNVKGVMDQIGGLKKADLKDPTEQLENVSLASDKAGRSSETLGEAVEHSHEHLHSLDEASHKLGETLEFLAGGFLELKGVEFVKELADTAARAQVLGTVLDVVGTNAGYSSKYLKETDEAVRSMGITAEASREGLTKYIQANFDLKYATTLARAAQDLAVISGENSSVTFQRMVNAIQTLSTEELRYMGIVVTNDEAQRSYALSIGKTAGALTLLEKQQALLQEVLTKSKDLTGNYERAMGDVGKQLTSLPRYIEDLKDALGHALLPAYLRIVEQLELFLKDMQLTTEAADIQSDAAEQLGASVGELASELREAGEWMLRHHTVLLRIIEAYAAFKVAGTGIKGAQTAWEAVSKLEGPLASLAEKLGIAGAEMGITGGAAAGMAAAFIAVVGSAAALILGGTKIGDVFSGLVGQVFEPLVGALELIRVAFEGLAGFGVAVANSFTSLLKYGDIKHPFQNWVDAFHSIKEEAKQAIARFKDWKKSAENLIDHPGQAGPETNRNHPEDAQNLAEVGKARRELEDARENKKSTPEDIERLEGNYEKALNKLDDKRKNLVNNVIETKNQLVAARADELQAIDTLNTLNERKGRGKEVSDDALKNAKEAVVRAHKQVTAYQEKFNNAQSDVEAAGETKEDAEADKKSVEAHVRQKRNEMAEQNNVNAQLQITQDTIDQYGNRVSAQFGKTSGGYGTLLNDFLTRPDGYTDPRQKADAISRLRNYTRDLGNAGRERGDVAGVDNLIEDTQKAVKNGQLPQSVLDGLRRAREKVATAAVEQEENYNSSSMSRAKQFADARHGLEIAGLQKDYDSLKDSNQRKESLDKESLDEGLLSLDNYHKNRVTRIQQETEAEIKLSQAKVAKLRDDLKNSSSAPERAAIRTSIQEEVNRQSVTRDRAETETFREEETNRKENFNFGVEATKQRDENEKNLQGVLSTEQEINDKYQERLRTLHLINAQGEEAKRLQEELNRAKDFELFQNRLEKIQRQDTLDLQRSESERNNLTEKVKYYSEHNQLGPGDSRYLSNYVTELGIQSQQRHFESLQQQIRETETELQSVQDRDGEYATALADKLDELQNKAKDVQTEMLKMASSIRTYAQELQQNLTDGISNALQTIVTNIRGSQEAIRNVFSGFTKVIVKDWADNFASNLVQNFVQKNSKPVYERDANGEMVRAKNPDGTPKSESPFDLLAKTLGLDQKKAKKSGSSEADAFYVRVVNPQASVDTNQTDAKAVVRDQQVREAKLKPGLSKTTPMFVEATNLPATAPEVTESKAVTPENVASVELPETHAAPALPVPILPEVKEAVTHLQSIANTLKEVGSSLKQVVSSAGPVGGTVAGEGLGSGIGTLIGRFSYGKHNAAARQISEEENSARGSQIGGLAGFVGGIFNDIRNNRKQSLERTEEAAQSGSAVPVATEEASTSLISNPDLATDASTSINPTLDTSSLQRSLNATATQVEAIPGTMESAAKASMDGQMQGLMDSIAPGLSSIVSGVMKAVNSITSSGGSGGWFGSGGVGGALGSLFGMGLSSMHPSGSSLFAMGNSGGPVGLTSDSGAISDSIALKDGGFVGGRTDTTTFGPMTVYEHGGDGKVAHFDRGGFVHGPGSSTSDSIPAALSRGEFVVKAASTHRFLPLLKAINNHRGASSNLRLPTSVSMPKFAEGGLVGATQTENGAASGSPSHGSAPTGGVFQIQAHPDLLKMSMQDVLNQFIASQFANR